jgi:hypothetical protein
VVARARRQDAGETPGRDGRATHTAVRNAFSKVTVVYTPGQFEQMAASLADLGREDLKRRIRDFRGRFKLDFSDDYLDALSLERLRHLLLAVLINAKAEP